MTNILLFVYTGSGQFLHVNSRAQIRITMAFTDVHVSSYSKNIMWNDLDVTFGIPGSSEVVYGNKYDHFEEIIIIIIITFQTLYFGILNDG